MEEVFGYKRKYNYFLNRSFLFKTKGYAAGINVWLCPALPYIEDIGLEWIRNFEFVLVNSLQGRLY